MAQVSKDVPPHWMVAALGSILLALMTLVVGLGVLSMRSVQSEFETFADEDFPGFNHLLHVDRDLFRAQRALETAYLTDDLDRRRASVDEYESQVEHTENRWAAYRGIAHDSPAEVELQATYETHRESWLTATAELAEMAVEGREISDPAVLEALREAESHFEPGQSAVHELVEDFYEPMVERGTDSAVFDARVLLLLVLLAGGLVLGGAASVAAVRATKEQYLQLRVRKLNKRFRSLVESAQDVITVVSDADTLTVLSSDLGVLGVTGTTADPSTVHELLGDSELAVWAAADRQVLGDQVSRSIELETTRADGAVVYLEAVGSPMIDDPTERVWVWRDITGRKELELQLSHQAFHDSLTGVANRSLLVDRAEHALKRSARSGHPVTVLFCDLDDFKTINDSLGHSRGDELLRVVTKRIQSSVRDSDTVARLGGDEFAVLLEEADTEAAVATAKRIIAAVPHEVDLGERRVFPSISIGIATAVPGTTTEELLRNADMAMYAAKRSGKGRAEIYQREMFEITSEHLDLQADLKSALAEGQFHLHYQPTVDLADGSVEGVEALIRWSHPTRGEIRPDEFIHIAEATGMIIAIGRWVLQEACRAAVELQGSGGQPLRMSVNLSPQQLRDGSIVATVQDALVDSGLEPEHLVLEVTEGSLLADTTAVARLHELRDIGVLIAVDDFGTGYSSINYLQSLPINIVKIDRSFVSGDALGSGERQAFLQAIVGLAKSLNLQSVAEGIEDASQLDELIGIGCDVGQGYLFSPAEPLDTAKSAIAQIETPANPSAVA